MENVRIWNYGEYGSEHYATHCQVVDIGSLRIYFSYSTPVAFHAGDGLICRENSWSTTTGRHLNWIQPDHKKRIPGPEFERLLAAEIAKRDSVALTVG